MHLGLGFLFIHVSAVLIFTTFPNQCLEVIHDHWFIKPCQVIEAQNFQYIDEVYHLCLVAVTNGPSHNRIGEDSHQCLIRDTPQLPLRFETLGKKEKAEQQFDLVPALGHGSKGVLIKSRGSNLCASIIDQNYPLHFQTCDPFSLLQTFSFAGAFKASRVQKMARPSIIRLHTT